MKIGKILKNLRFDKYIFFLATISIVLLASTVRYGLRTYKVPEWDEQHYMRMATEFYRLIKNNLSLSTPYQMLQVVPFRQPGYPLLILPFLMVFGLSNSYFWGIFTNGLLYVASIFGIYFLAKNFLSKFPSFTAAAIFAFYGWTLLHLHLTYSETADSAFTIWTILFLTKSNLFQNKKYSILFGVFLGLGMLVRWVIAVYILGPLLFVLYLLIKKRLFKKKKIVIQLCMAFLIALIVSFYPYLQNNYWIFQYFYGHHVGGQLWQALPQQESNPFSIYSLTFYLNSFAQLGIFFFVLIIVGFVLALRKKSNIKLILSVVIIGYLFSVLAPIKGERYIVPIFPYLAILSASVFDYIKNRRFYLLLIYFTIVLSVVSFLGSVWAKGPMKQSLASLPIELPFGQWKRIYLTTYSRPPYIYKISGKDFLDFIEEDSKEAGIKNPQVLSLFYYRPLDEPLMTYNLYNEEKPLQINNFVGTVTADPQKDSGSFIDNLMRNTDYVLIKTGQRLDNYFSPVNYKTLKALIILFDKDIRVSNYYDKKAQFWINQDSSEVTIFRKKREIPDQKLENMRLRFVEILKAIGDSLQRSQ